MQDGILIGGTIALTVATGGAAAPLMLATASAVGGGFAGYYAASTYESSGTITGQGLLHSFTEGFMIGSMVSGGVAGLLKGAGEAGAAAIAAEEGATTSTDAADTWVSLRSLLYHFGRHGAEFGAADPERICEHG